MEDKSKNKLLLYFLAIQEAIIEEMQRDDRVLLMGENTNFSEKTEMLRAHFNSDRILNTPICENGFTGMAIGAALTGLRPIVDLDVANFMYLAFDQMINQASKSHFMTGGQLNVPVVFRATLCHNTSNAAQHSDRPYAMLMNIPGLKIIVPATAGDVKGMLKSAIRDNDPVVVFEDANLLGNAGIVSTDPEHLVPIGKADVKRQGDHVSLITIGSCLIPALAAADTLTTQGISAEVIDVRSLVPLDKKTIIQSITKTGCAVIVDNANLTASAASEIAATLAENAFDKLRAPIKRVTTPDVHIPYSPPLEKTLYPQKEDIIKAVLSLNTMKDNHHTQLHAVEI